MILKEKCVQIGYVSKPHGVKGEMAVSLLEGFYAEDLDLEFLLLDIDNGLVPFFVESLRIKGGKTILAKLESVDAEEKAREFVNTEVYVHAESVHNEEDMPSGAFLGFRVIDQKKGGIGIITGVNEIANNPLFVLDFEGREILFPVNTDFILQVDEKNKEIEVNLPEGLIDLYLSDEDDKDDDF